MENVKVDTGDPTPLYQQVAAEIRRSISDGEAKPGERMPLAKDLARVLGVNTNTVLRALRELRDEGLLEFRRGRGITVAGSPERGAVMTRVNELVRFARDQGYQPDELIRIRWISLRDPYLSGYAPLHACFEQSGLGDYYTAAVESILKGGPRPSYMLSPKDPLLGMGGSTLAPEVLYQTFGRQAGFPEFHMLDSTDPTTIRRAVAAGGECVERVGNI